MDAAELANLFDANAATLTLYARQWLPPDRARDVVQDIFLRLVVALRSPANPKAWMFCAVRNAAISDLRSHHRRRQREQRVAHATPEFFQSSPGDRIDAAAAQQALSSLDPLAREIITLRLWASMTFPEIASITQTPLSTVHDRYRAGLARIRQTMEPSCNL